MSRSFVRNRLPNGTYKVTIISGVSESWVDSEGNERYEWNSGWDIGEDGEPEFYGEYEWYSKYKNGNSIYFVDSTGQETWSEFDEDDNEIYCRDGYGFEIWQAFDSKGKLKSWRNSEGYEYEVPADE